MPVEIKDKEEFKKIAEKAIECRVKKDEKKGIVKIKARTKRYLYTIKLKSDEAESFIKELKCEKIEYIE